MGSISNFLHRLGPTKAALVLFSLHVVERGGGGDLVRDGLVDEERAGPGSKP